MEPAMILMLYISWYDYMLTPFCWFKVEEDLGPAVFWVPAIFSERYVEQPIFRVNLRLKYVCWRFFHCRFRNGEVHPEAHVWKVIPFSTLERVRYNPWIPPLYDARYIFERFRFYESKAGSLTSHARRSLKQVGDVIDLFREKFLVVSVDAARTNWTRLCSPSACSPIVSSISVILGPQSRTDMHASTL